MLLFGKEPKDIKIGEVVVYESHLNPNPIIHRVIGVKENKFLTKGDHNKNPDTEYVTSEQMQRTGKAVFRVPWFGWVKIWFNDLIVYIRRLR